MKFLEELHAVWPAIMTAPWAFLALALIFAGGIWKFANLHYNQKDLLSQRHISELKDQLSGAKSRLDELKVEKQELLEKLGEQAEHGRIAALPVAQLKQRTLEFVGEAREWLTETRRLDNERWARPRERRGLSMEDEDARWIEESRASMNATTMRYGEWDAKFKVRSIVLRDELRKHVPDMRDEDEKIRHMNYDHPTNPIGMGAVIDDLEHKALLL